MVDGQVLYGEVKLLNGALANLSEPTLTYTGGDLTRVDYPNGSYKVLTYNPDGTLDTIDYSGEYTKHFVWSSGVLQSIGVS
jgi:hypothetical protein